MDGTEYITLKEAAEISGYSPDYVGQLIRRGKLPGKQVYANVAWVTPKEALLAYLSGKEVKLTKEVNEPRATKALPGWLRMFALSPEEWEPIVRRVAIAIIGLSILFLIFLFHILSTLIDERMNEEALRRVTVNPVPPTSI